MVFNMEFKIVYGRSGAGKTTYIFNEIKRKIKEESYEMLENVYLANITTDLKNRQENLEKVIAKVKVIDFLVNLSYDKKIINQKRFLKVGQRLDDISKYVTGWIKVTVTNKE